MKTRAIDFLKRNSILLIFFVYSVVSAFCLIFAGDDYAWFAIDKFSDIFTKGVGNGRYFTNIITYFMIKNTPLRILIYTVFMIVLFRTVSVLISNTDRSRFSSDFFTVISFFSLSTEIFWFTFRWISGFTNYIIGTMLLCLYILYNKKLLEGKPLKQSTMATSCCFILGFLSVLCVENVTLYCLAFSVFILIFSYLRYKKVFDSNISYFIGNIIGTFLLFSNKNYSTIINDDFDAAGERYIELDFSDILMKIYSEILHYFSKPFIFIHLIIIGSLLFANVRKYSHLSEKRPKYNLFFTIILCMYSVYEVFVFFISDFSEFDSSCKIYAFESALTFLYSVGIIYLSFETFDRNSFIRICLYLCSAYFVTLPFLVVNPVTARCFFTDFIFWTLLAGEIFMSSFSDFDIRFVQLFKSIALFITASFLVFFSYTSILNKYVDSIRYDYIKEQLEKGYNGVELIKLPYPNLAIDYISCLSGGEDENSDVLSSYKIDSSYFDWMCYCYGIDSSKLRDVVRVEISIYDYNNEKEFNFT